MGHCQVSPSIWARLAERTAGVWGGSARPGEASFENREVADLYERGQVCPHAHYFIEHPNEYEDFCRTYNIPDDVVVSQLPDSNVSDKLKELHNLEFTVVDLFRTYIMSRHGKTNRRYLSTRNGKEPLIDGLPDTDKWANFYVEGSNNYEFGDQTVRLHTVPKIKDFRGTAPLRQKDADAAEPTAKKQKVTRDFFPSRPPTPLPKERDQTESSTAGGSKDASKTVGSGERATSPEFSPSYAMADGRVVLVEDSVKLEPRIAVTMLRGLVLPKDMERVPPELQPSLVHASAYLVQVLVYSVP
ncbi:hypothetical protein RHMOL_Rhmol01G0194500 [Rhododendron molle]|uniref:Uncharacterized protein n=1 Tax=Rhododendron molle TaxID=49168 RepID=A0ACC0Q3R5_RHOML|nr:hypothetical protein RHMOL_Rhmol01G0194500 [Rhododendron molle]